MTEMCSQHFGGGRLSKMCRCQKGFTEDNRGCSTCFVRGPNLSGMWSRGRKMVLIEQLVPVSTRCNKNMTVTATQLEMSADRVQRFLLLQV